MGRRVEAPLPAWEQTTYWIVGVSSILYGLYNVFLASLDLQDKLEYVEDGYEILGRKQDVEDYEWYIYSMYFCWKLPPLLLLHIAVSRAMFLLNIDVQTRKYVYVLNGVMLAWGLQSWRFSVLLCLTPVPFLAASALRSVPAVWAVSVAATYLCNAYADDLMNLLGVTDSLNYFVVIYIWASVFLRCTCCAVERVWSLNQATFASTPGHSKNSSRVTRTGSSQNSSAGSAKKRSTSACQKENGCQSDTQGQLYDWPVLSKVPSVCDMYLCVFYTPSLFTGPPVTFKSFIEQIENPAPMSRDRLLSVLWGSLRVCFWFLFNNVMFHFFYFKAEGIVHWTTTITERLQGSDSKNTEDSKALSYNTILMESVNKWTLTTTAYLVGQFMTNKYVVIYGWMRQIAKLDGLDLAENPACVGYIYAYSDMWKSFDRGLHSCLKRYLYVPLGGSQAGLLRCEAANLITFLFVGYWHGGGTRYITWSLLNFAEVNLEMVGYYLERCSAVQENVVKRVSERGMRRVRCVLLYPVWLLAGVSNMCFLAGPEFAYVYATRICLQWDSFLAFSVIFYCLAQGAKHLERLGCTKFS